MESTQNIQFRKAKLHITPESTYLYARCSPASLAFELSTGFGARTTIIAPTLGERMGGNSGRGMAAVSWDCVPAEISRGEGCPDGKEVHGWVSVSAKPSCNFSWTFRSVLWLAPGVSDMEDMHCSGLNL